MIRKRLLLFLFACLVIGCSDSDSAHLNVLYDVHLILSETSEVTDITPEAWETIRRVREAQLYHWEWVMRECPECILIDAEEEYERLLAKAAAEKEQQEAFYNRYIDADSIAIVGNTCTPDAFFVAAKRIVLIMTSKRPELRKQLRGLWYFDIRSSLPHDEDCITIPLSLIPEWPVPASGTCGVTGELHHDGSPVYQYQLRSPEHPWHAAYIPRAYADTDVIHVGRCFAEINRYPSFSMSTFVHEFAHALHGRIYDLDRTMKGEFHKAYDTAIANGTWDGLYASYSLGEYWAEMVQYWFYYIGTRDFETYEDFKERDPLAYALLDKWFPKVSFNADDILGLKDLEIW